ncbi:hypothetical protein [Rubrivirga sp.]|uniref:hypothetical protein n=1 Tax=Rubrivirga sp. TaxID=1885344 RepID=UPI003B52A6C3
MPPLSAGYYIPHITTGAPGPPDAGTLYQPVVRDFKGALAEAILFGDRVTIDLGTGAVPELLKWFGGALFEEVMETGKVEFAYSEPIASAGYVSEALARQSGGATGLATVSRKGLAFNTPFGRAQADIRGSMDLPKWKVRLIARQVERGVREIPTSVYRVAHAAARADITSSVGGELFFPRDVDPDAGTLSEPDVRKYLAVAGANVKLATAAELGIDRIVGNHSVRLVMLRRLADLANGAAVALEDIQTLLDVEGVPDLGALLRDEALTFQDVVDLSYTRPAEEFREWLGDRDRDSATDVARAYAAEVRERARGDLSTRALRVVAATVAGALFGPFDPSGLVVGATVNAVTEFYGHRLGQAWEPMVFMDTLRDL